MKRTAIIASFLFLLLFPACREEYAGDNPIIPRGGNAYIVSVGEDNSISVLDPASDSRRIIVPADTLYRRLIEAVGDLIFYSERHIEAGRSEVRIYTIDPTYLEHGTVGTLRYESDPSSDLSAFPCVTVTPDGEQLFVFAPGRLDRSWPSRDTSRLDLYVEPANFWDVDGADPSREIPSPEPSRDSIGLPYGTNHLTRPICSPDRATHGFTVALCYDAGAGYARMVTMDISNGELTDFGLVGTAYASAARRAGPTWSPDGSRLAIIGADGRSIDIYNAAGAKQSSIPVAPSDAGAGGATIRALYWSPKGDRFAAVMDGWGSNNEYRIYGIGLNGGLSEMVKFNPPGTADPTARIDYFCDWSPDGTRLIFLGEIHEGTQGYNLYVTDDGENGPRRFESLQSHVREALWMRPGMREY